MNTDRDLILSFIHGNEFAFVAIYNRYKQGIYAYSLRMLRNDKEAEDVMQDTFLKAYEYRNKLVDIQSLRAWLFTVARNKCLNRIRLKKSHGNERFEESILSIASANAGNSLEKHELVKVVSEGLAKLSDDYREVIILREYQNLSYEEICVVTHSSLNSVKSRLFKARKKLAEILFQSEIGKDISNKVRKNS